MLVCVEWGRGRKGMQGGGCSGGGGLPENTERNLLFSVASNDVQLCPVVCPADVDLQWPFGIASATRLRSWTGWTNCDEECYDYDTAIIYLDRPIGDRAGCVPPRAPPGPPPLAPHPPTPCPSVAPTPDTHSDDPVLAGCPDGSAQGTWRPPPWAIMGFRARAQMNPTILQDHFWCVCVPCRGGGGGEGATAMLGIQCISPSSLPPPLPSP